MARDNLTPAEPGLRHVGEVIPPVVANIAAKARLHHDAVLWERRAPGQRPGERMLNGKPYVFNADSLNRYLAEDAVATALADLTSMSVGELASMDYRCIRRLADTGHRDPAALALHARVTAERRARGMDVAFGSAA